MIGELLPFESKRRFSSCPGKRAWFFTGCPLGGMRFDVKSDRLLGIKDMKIGNIRYYLNGYVTYKRFNDPPVIIGACERSGTSLLQSIISAHPGIFAIEEETWAFCYGPAAGFKGNSPIRIGRLYKSLARKTVPSSCTRWCEKSPANIFYFDSILEYFSNDIRLLHIIRDGRDVVTSIHPSNPLKPWVSIGRWVQAVEEGYRYRDYDQVLTIRYEDLITNYEKTASLICEHIGVNVDNNILNWHKHAIIKSSKNLMGNTIDELSSKSIHKFESDDFKYKSVVDEFMENEKAVNLLKIYNYI